LLREGDSVFRFAGDEFVVLLPNQDLASATQIGLRFTAHFQQARFDWQGQPLQACFSWGAASSAEDGLDAPALLLRAADKRLYEQKRQPR
jgi:diguanylate cyclase (GGDEF)-like protein